LRGIAVAQLRGVQRLRTTAGFTLLELLVVVGLIGVISAVAMPMFGRAVANYRVIGAARSLSNALAVTKIRSAATFTRTRLFVDLGSGTHHLELLDRTVDPPHWTTEGGSTYLPYGVGFAFAPVGSAPPNTQSVISQSVPCTQDDGTPIANTACITFNSRGIPVDSTGAPVANGALYVSDSTAVYGVTVAATGMIRLWRTFPYPTPNWLLQ
jgi:prepilin-type N-terminal cleavage/methylation domain-containing protein